MKINTTQRTVLIFTGITLALWVFLFLTHKTSGPYNDLYSFMLAILPFCGGIIAVRHAREWKGTEGFMGKGMLCVGLGLFCWGLGSLVWSYFNIFQNVLVPYPSVADIAYLPSVFFYCIGSVYLARAAGADFGLKSPHSKMFVILALVGVMVISYYFLIVIARHGTLIIPGDSFLKTFLDISYPLGDFISLALAVVISGLSFRFLRSEYKHAIISLLTGLGVMAVADSLFSYTTTTGTYFNGSLCDLLFLIGMFLLTFGALGFCSTEKDGEEKSLHIFRFLWYS